MSRYVMALDQGTTSSRAILFDRDLAVHEHEAVAGGALDAAPLAAGLVLELLDRQHLQVLEVVDDDVRGLAHLDRAAVAVAGDVGGKRRKLGVRVLEREDVGLANGADERLGQARIVIG